MFILFLPNDVIYFANVDFATVTGYQLFLLNALQVIPLECYEGTSSTGKLVPIVPGGRSIPLTFHNRLDYIDRAVHFRLHEMDLQVINN